MVVRDDGYFIVLTVSSTPHHHCSTPTPTCPIHTVLDATGDCVSLAVAQDIQNGILPIADGKLRLATVPPVPNTNTIAPICPDISHLVGSKCVMNGQDANQDMFKMKIFVHQQLDHFLYTLEVQLVQVAALSK